MIDVWDWLKNFFQRAWYDKSATYWILMALLSVFLCNFTILTGCDYLCFAFDPRPQRRIKPKAVSAMKSKYNTSPKAGDVITWVKDSQKGRKTVYKIRPPLFQERHLWELLWLTKRGRCCISRGPVSLIIKVRSHVKGPASISLSYSKASRGRAWLWC